MSLIHGGNLNKMAQQYGIAVENWLDLSTGISPISYPVPLIPEKVWQQLPQTSDALISAAKQYYGTNHITATSGSQYIIQKLPQLFSDLTQVWLPLVGYKEHEKAWQHHGVTIKHYHTLPQPEQLANYAIVVVINPNNPSGKLYKRDELAALLEVIESKNGHLVVDEAFMDVIEPTQSMIDLTDSKHLFVLRSVGKFFGLAGIRLGFVSAHPSWLNIINSGAGPWQVNGPAQFIGEKALADKVWQIQQRQTLAGLSSALETLLVETFDVKVQGTTLFKTVKLNNAQQLFDQLCRQGVYVRLCDEKNALRFGVPTEQGLVVLAEVLAKTHQKKQRLRQASC